MKYSNLSPIVLFVYNRPYHTRKALDALKNNNLADESILYIYADGPKENVTYEQKNKIAEVRKLIRSENWCKVVRIIESNINNGLSNSIISGVTDVINKYGKVIVLEDDLIISTHFLTYMNDALEKHKNDERIISIHGYVYPIDTILSDPFFLKGADCWGWATWKRGWAYFNPDGQYLLNKLRQKRLIKSFNFNNTYPYSEMLENQITGKTDSWAIRWYASAFLANKLTLYPGRSLVQNIGNDNSGTNCDDTLLMNVMLSENPIILDNNKVKPSKEANLAFQRFFSKGQFMSNNLKRKSIIRKGMSYIRLIVKDFTPPILQRWIRIALHKKNENKQLLSNDCVYLEGDFSTWEEAKVLCTGYEDKEILEKVLSATLKVKNGEAVYERDSVIFDKIEYSWPVLTGLMLAAAINLGKLIVLDFGGSLGSSYFQNLKFLKELPEVSWGVVEQDTYVNAGKKHIENDKLHFYNSIEDFIKENKPNVVLLSSVLQYLPDPFNLLIEIVETKPSIIILDRTSYIKNEEREIIKIQHVPDWICKSNYPCRLFIEKNILDFFTKNGYYLIESFDSLDNLDDLATWKGHILASNSIN